MFNRMSSALLGDNLKQALLHTLRRDKDADGLRKWASDKGSRVKDTIQMNFDNYLGANHGDNSNIRAKFNEIPAQVYVTEERPKANVPPGTKVDPDDYENVAFDDEGKRLQVPVGEMSKNNKQRVGRGEALIARAARYPVRAAGIGLPAVYLADQFLGQPIEGTVDAVTLGLTNFKEDETRGVTFGDRGSVPYSVPYAQGTALDSNNNIVPNVAAPVPPLSQKDLDYEIQRQRKYIATNSITLRELERMQREAQMRNNYA